MTFLLTNVAKYYKDLEHQQKALDWFDASTGKAKQQTFARIYRNKGQNSSDTSLTEEPDIVFKNAFLYFEGTKWQVDALNWLQANTDPKILAEFERLWKAAPKIINVRDDYFVQMTHNRTRIPQSRELKLNVERACSMLEELEKHLGVFLTLTSGFRPEPINSRVGGVPGSQHTLGLAADFYSAEMDDFELENKVIDYWYKKGKGGVGKGMAYRNFVHVDLGYPRMWNY